MNKVIYFEKLFTKRREKLIELCTKKGFVEEIRSFIKALKRQTVTEDDLINIINKVENEILKSKLEDIYIIYKAYNKSLSDNNVYDINDISLKAVEFVKNSKVLHEYDAIIIDGFINIDVVNLELINEISKSKDIDIYVNSSFRNSLIEAFIKDEIVNKLKIMDFQIVENIKEEYESDENIKQILRMLYSGEKLSSNYDSKQNHCYT